MAKTLSNNIVNDIKSSEVYAIMLDESTDISVKKRLSICMRYVRNGAIFTTFICNLPLADGCAITIINCVFDEFSKLGIFKMD
jgi:hypothetical protein